MTVPTTAPETATALQYLQAGWPVLNLAARTKDTPPPGRTGYDGIDMTEAEVMATDWSGNIALRMPDGNGIAVIGIDIDVYHGGDKTFQNLKNQLGAPPRTWASHSGRGDGSGIYFYKVPVGRTWLHSLPGIEIIQRTHRYAVVWPSIHPEGRQYRWFDLAEQAPTEDIPRTDELPDLPWPWINYLSRAWDNNRPTKAATAAETQEFLKVHTRADDPGYLKGVIVKDFRDHWQQGFARHDTMMHDLYWAMEDARAGVFPAADALRNLHEIWKEAFHNEPNPARRRTALDGDEFPDMLRRSVGNANAKTEDQLRIIHDKAAGPVMADAPAAALTINDYQPELKNPFLDWQEFANREEQPRRWVVEHFWPWGRALALWAEAKAGKSELALWCAAKLALGEHPWTGAPIEPLDIAYFDFEMTADDLEERLSNFDFDPLKLGHLHYALLPEIDGLDFKTGGDSLIYWVLEVGAQAVIIDTFLQSVAGEEDKSDTVKNFGRWTGNRLKKMGIGYLRTDHAGKQPGKGRGPRGSSAKQGDIDVAWWQRRLPGGTSIDCTGSSRLNWVGPTLRIDRYVDNTGIVSYALPIQFGWPAGTAEKAAELDQLGVPNEAGRPAAIAALRAAGLKPGRFEVLGAALRYRRESPQMSQKTAGTAPGTPPERDPPEQGPEQPGTELDLYSD